jgi:hypothetical protein
MRRSGRGVLETTRFAGEFVMHAAIHCYQFIECGRSGRRSFEGRGVENSGLGITEGALLDGTVVPHTMSTQRNWEKNSLRGLRGHKVLKVPRTVGFKLGLHFYTDSGFGRRGGLMVRWRDVTDDNDCCNAEVEEVG